VSGETPLFFAILGQGSRAIVQYLINSGADPNKANNRGITPLHLAAGQGFFCPCYVCFGVLAVSLSFFLGLSWQICIALTQWVASYFYRSMGRETWTLWGCLALLD
jgi:hypothetical protein